MNRTMKLALSTLLGMSLVIPAMAQDNFPDVKDNHWAYEAVANLKGKVLFGYPDGTYKGARQMTRYEFAVAVNQLWSKLQEQFKGVQEQIAALPTGGGNNNELKDQVNELKKQVDGMKDWGTAIGDLQKLSKEFEKELTSLGVDVDKMKSQLKDLDARVAKLEGVKLPVAISGNVDFVVLAGHSTSGNLGATVDGRLEGFGRSNLFPGAPVGMTKDFSVFHQAVLKLAGTNTDGPKWKAALVIGNGFNNAALGDLSSHNVGAPFNDSGNTSIYLQEANATFDTALVGQGFSATVGRFGWKVGKYLYQRTDYTSSYVTDEYRSDGKYYGDGAALNFGFGKASVTVAGFRNSGRRTDQGVQISPIGPVDQTLGIQVQFPISEMGGLNLAYLWHDSNTVQFGGFDRLTVFGGELNLKFSNINLYGAYTKTDTKLGNSNVNTSDNAAYELSLAYKADKYSFGAGYKQVQQNFAAAGDWGRIGTWWNPTNVKGFNVNATFMASDAMSLKLKAEFLQGANTFANVLASTDDKARSFGADLGFKISGNFGANLSYEDVLFQYNTGPQPTERWYGIGFNYGLAGSTTFGIKYQVSDLDGKGGGVPILGGPRYQGGLLSSQLSIKF